MSLEELRELIAQNRKMIDEMELVMKQGHFNLKEMLKRIEQRLNLISEELT